MAADEVKGTKEAAKVKRQRIERAYSIQEYQENYLQSGLGFSMPYGECSGTFQKECLGVGLGTQGYELLGPGVY